MHRVLALLPCLLLAACGGGGDAAAPLKVSAAASLKPALTADGAADGGRTSFSFAGSDELAAQIRGGARPDVFAAANARLPEQLAAEGLVERPVAFARNRLAVAVAKGSDARSLADLRRPGTTLAVGAPGVPIGDYTATVLSRLPAADRRALDAAVRSREPDVSGIVGKVTQGAVDAGVVYVSDVRASKGALRAIALPAALQPEVVYKAAVVKGAKHAPRARAFVADLRDGDGRRRLRAAGFLPAP